MEKSNSWPGPLITDLNGDEIFSGRLSIGILKELPLAGFSFITLLVFARQRLPRTDGYTVFLEVKAACDPPPPDHVARILTGRLWASLWTARKKEKN